MACCAGWAWSRFPGTFADARSTEARAYGVCAALIVCPSPKTHEICLLGLDNLPVLAPEYREHTVRRGVGAADAARRALARRGHEVSMVTADYGQTDAAVWEDIRVYRPIARSGPAALRFVHPRWSGLWSALARADAQLYYTSCAGMQVALLALFCARHGRRFVSAVRAIGL